MKFNIASLLCLLAVPLVASAERPNVLIMLCDDIGAHELALYGHPEHSTPNLDQLGRTGIWFTTGYSTPICHPTRFEIMTGSTDTITGCFTFLAAPAGRRRIRGRTTSPAT